LCGGGTGVGVGEDGGCGLAEGFERGELGGVGQTDKAVEGFEGAGAGAGGGERLAAALDALERIQRGCDAW